MMAPDARGTGLSPRALRKFLDSSALKRETPAFVERAEMGGQAPALLELVER
jgi:hypothetical protein